MNYGGEVVNGYLGWDRKSKGRWRFYFFLEDGSVGIDESVGKRKEYKRSSTRRRGWK